MASYQKKLAESLEILRKVTQNGIVRSADLTRTHRERLVQAGFLTEAVKGWLIETSPGVSDGDSTVWYASFWPFVGRYLHDRFQDDYCLSAEASIGRHVGASLIPKQVTVIIRHYESQRLSLPFETSLFLYGSDKQFPADRVSKDGVWLMSLPEALTRVSPAFFMTNPIDAEVALRMVRDPSQLLHHLLSHGGTTRAGRLAGAYSFLGETAIAEQITVGMKGAGHSIRPENPFERLVPSLHSGLRVASPYMARIQALWAEMRQVVIDAFPDAPGLPRSAKEYRRHLDEIYLNDSYNSLSIEGYQVTPRLIERVRSGAWGGGTSGGEENDRQALAARGYHLAFQQIANSIDKIIEGGNSGEIASREHQTWFRELFSPLVLAGAMTASQLAGYRNGPVYIRGARHVPVPKDAVVDCMESLFDLLTAETESSVRAVLGHFFFVYIHPYHDGNGRLGRFLMNAMLASGGYPWTVIRVSRRSQYMSALDQASGDNHIGPFARFIREEMDRGTASYPQE